MIKYNNSSINDWNFGDDNIIKVYRNNAVCYYKITGGGDTPTAQTPCFAVVDDISQYQETEFEDVFNKADNKWYKLNNLNQYEEYGIYGSGRTITTYEGKLTIDDGYEYMYSGGSWTNIGEVSGSSVTIKSPEYIEKDSSHNGKINLDYVWKTNTKMQFKLYSTNNGGGGMIGEQGAPDNNDCRVFFASTSAYFDYGSDRITWSTNGRVNTLYEYEYGNYYIKNMVTSAIKTGTTFSTNRTNTLTLGNGASDRFRTYYIKIYEGNTLVKDFIPWTDLNGNYGLYDKVSLSVYNVASGTLTGSSNVTDVEVASGYTYPVYYDVIQDPPNNLAFSSMAEAEAYECPWVGMNATIDGDKYVFSGDSQSGYEWVYNPSRLPQGYTEVEYIKNIGTSTSNGAYLNLGLPLYDTIGNSFVITSRLKSKYYSASGDNVLETIINSESVSSPYYGFVYRYAYSNHNIELASNPSNHATLSTTANTDGTTSITINCNSTTVTDQVPLGLFASYNANYNTPYRFAKATIYSLTVVKNSTTVRDLVPCKRDSDNKYGMYDIVNDVFYVSPNNVNFSGGNPV